MYDFNTRIRYSEVDSKGRLTIVSLVNLFQDCATFHSEDVGFGLEWLSERQRGGFVTSYQIRIEEMPYIGEEVRVATYPTSVKGLIGERYFTLTSRDEKKVYARAKSIWVYMDNIEKKPSRIPDEMGAAYKVGNPPTDEDWGRRKISGLSDCGKVYDFTVSPLFIDSNHHMNNAYYIEAAMEALPEGYDIGELRIEYRKPAELNNSVHVYEKKEGDVIQIQLLADDDEMYSIVEFKERKDA